MSSVSFYEQLTSSVSLSLVGVVAVGTLALILVYTAGGRFFASSSTKSKSNSSSNKDKKTKETNSKKQQQPQAETTTSTKKKNNNKAKTSPTTTVPAKTVVSSSSPSSQSEESEEEKVAPVAPSKKQVASSKAVASKKVPVTDENNKSAVATNGAQASPTKQQASARNGNTREAQSADTKKKQPKAVAAPASNKPAAASKDDTKNKVNATASNKNQTAVVGSQVTRTSVVDNEAGSDQEDEGQWLTQGSTKQVNNRNRNKAKPEVPSAKNQDAPSNRKGASEKRTAPATSANTNSALTNQNDSDVETPVTSNTAAIPTPTAPQPVQPPEPIEICQLLPASENRYTANDNWWKQALNKQQTFTVNDIGEWPEREEDEQYVVNVRRIVPVKSTINNSKTALSEKDINVDGNDEINNYKNGKEDEKLNFDEQVNAGESATAASQSKKKSAHVRRLS